MDLETAVSLAKAYLEAAPSGAVEGFHDRDLAALTRLMGELSDLPDGLLAGLGEALGFRRSRAATPMGHRACLSKQLRDARQALLTKRFGVEASPGRAWMKAVKVWRAKAKLRRKEGVVGAKGSEGVA